MYSATQNVKSIEQNPKSGPVLLNSVNTVHRVRQQIQIRIPQKYAQEPIISNLIKRYEIEVNIRSALLATSAQESGWFDLELYGTPARIQQTLDYLAQLDVEIWDSDRTPQTDWTFN
jgi:ABC-type methionine transport system ATPase subunit